MSAFSRNSTCNLFHLPVPKLNYLQYYHVLKKAAWIICLAGICCGLQRSLQAQSWTNTTLSASQRASLLLGAMTFSEKAAMVYGVAGPTGSNYVGNIANNTRLGIPWLFLNDGPAGL